MEVTMEAKQTHNNHKKWRQPICKSMHGADHGQRLGWGSTARTCFRTSGTCPPARAGALAFPTRAAALTMGCTGSHLAVCSTPRQRRATFPHSETGPTTATRCMERTPVLPSTSRRRRGGLGMVGHIVTRRSNWSATPSKIAGSGRRSPPCTASRRTPAGHGSQSGRTSPPWRQPRRVVPGTA